MHGHQGFSRANHRMVCASLASRSHLSRSSHPFRGGDTTAMGGSVYPAYYACFAGFVFHSHLAGKLACPKAETARSTNGLVFQETANLFGRPEYCEKNLALSSSFSNFAVLQRNPKSAAPLLQLPLFSLYSYLSSCIFWIKSSLGKISPCAGEQKDPSD